MKHIESLNKHIVIYPIYDNQPVDSWLCDALGYDVNDIQNI